MSILDSIASFFKKLWDIVKKVLVYILIICAILLILWACFFSGGALLFGLLTATQAIVVACVALAGAFLLDGDTADQIVSSVGSATADAVTSVGGAVGDVAGATAGAVGDVAGDLLEGVLSSPIGWIAIGIVAYLFLKGGSKESEEPRTVDRAAKVADGPSSSGSQRLESREPKTVGRAEKVTYDGYSSLGTPSLAALEA